MPNKFSFEGQTTEDIFSRLATRQLTALTFHSSAVEVFQFLNLNGFKRWQEYRVTDEYFTYRNILAFFAKTYNKLLPRLEMEFRDAVPNGWLKYSRFDVDKETRKKSVVNFFNDWRDWERETLDFLQAAATHLDDLGEIVASNFVQDMAEDNRQEIKDLENCLLKLKASDFDSEYLLLIQPKLHKKYKRKMK